MEEAFASAIVNPPQPIIIGARMQPYSLGHHLLLSHFRSAFVTREGFPQFEDLIAGAFVCANTWEENQKLLRAPFRRWFTLKVWGLFAGKFDVARAIVALSRYIADGERYPVEIENPTSDQSSRQLYAPTSARLYRFLRASGFTETEAMNMPLPVAKFMDAATAEEAGTLEIQSLQRIAFWDLARKQRR